MFALVAGGTGFIGSHLVKHLLGQGAEVSVLSLHAKVQLAGARLLQADLCDRQQLKNVLSPYQFTHVFNLGGYINHSPLAKEGRSVMNTHFQGALNLIQLVNKPCLQAFVQIGSSDEYGNAPSPQQESYREAPISPYSLAKTAVTQTIQMLARSEGFPGTVVRPFLVYGPGQNQQRFLPQIIMGCLHDEIFPTSAGEQIRDFCYIDDIVEALFLAAMSKKSRGKVINIASGQPVAIKEMLQNVQAMIGKGKPQIGALAYRQGENMSLYADISLAKALLNWAPKTTLQQGLQQTIAYYQKQLQKEEV